MIILRKLGPLFCSFKRVHAGIFMLACPHFNEQNKRPNLLSIITWSVLGKQNVQAEKVSLIGHFGKYHNNLCLSPQILHKHFLQFLLGLTMVPRENKNNAYEKFGRTNKEYYGIFGNGL